eukprot:jgi/Chlat1/3919/Chrsp26S04186
MAATVMGLPALSPASTLKSDFHGTSLRAKQASRPQVQAAGPLRVTAAQNPLKRLFSIPDRPNPGARVKSSDTKEKKGKAAGGGSNYTQVPPYRPPGREVKKQKAAFKLGGGPLAEIPRAARYPGNIPGAPSNTPDPTNKNWKDASGRAGTGKGVYRFRKKYDGNVDEYSPIWTPETWSDGGEVYQPGVAGLAAWALVLTAVLSFGAYAIISTSAV